MSGKSVYDNNTVLSEKWSAFTVKRKTIQFFFLNLNKKIWKFYACRDENVSCYWHKHNAFSFKNDIENILQVFSNEFFFFKVFSIFLFFAAQEDKSFWFIHKRIFISTCLKISSIPIELSEIKWNSSPSCFYLINSMYLRW